MGGRVTWFPKVVECFNIRFYGKRTLIRKIIQWQTWAWFCFVTSTSRKQLLKCNILESKDEKYHVNVQYIVLDAEHININ